MHQDDLTAVLLHLLPFLLTNAQDIFFATFSQVACVDFSVSPHTCQDYQLILLNICCQEGLVVSIAGDCSAEMKQALRQELTVTEVEQLEVEP